MSAFPKMLIAEIGSVHDGSFGNAKRLIDAAAEAGAHAVKFQTHLPEAESLPSAPAPAYFKDESRMEYFARTGFTLERWKALKAHADAKGVLFLSSPFSIEAVDLLEQVGMPFYKIPSGEVSNTPLLERVAETGKPVLLSSGMSDWVELDRAVEVFKKASSPLLLMQCASQYPCAPEHIGFNVLLEMRKRYECPVGFSDHTLGLAAPIAAAALGALVIEKHFTFSKLMYGSDASHSMEPGEFKVLAKGLNEVWRALENPVDKSDTTAFKEMKKIFEKSVVTATQVERGKALTRSDLAFKKPGTGIPAWQWERLIGRRAARGLDANQLIREEDLE